MPLTREEFTRLIAEGESQTVEFKVRVRDSRDLATLIGAMANTAGGRVLVGVQEPNSVVGVDPAPLRRLYQSALRQVRPTPATSLHFLDLDGKFVGVVEIEAARALVVSSDGALVREGVRVRPMAATEIAAHLEQNSPSAKATRNALADGLADLTMQISELTMKLDRANSIVGQLPNYLIGGAVGAILGWLLTRS